MQARFFATSVLAAAALLAWTWGRREQDLTRVEVTSLPELERQLEAWRIHLRIPGMSAAIAQGDQVLWARGFGMADVERAVPAAADTVYHLASVTKPYASTVLLQLVDEGRLALKAPIAEFGVAIERSTPVTVWHLLSHTSHEPPGSGYRYDGNAFGQTASIIEQITRQPFAKVLTDRIIRPLGLTRTAPNPGTLQPVSSLFFSLAPTSSDVEASRAAFDASGLDRAEIASALAVGYAPQWGRSIWPAGLFGPMRPMPHAITLSAAGGLVASAPDVARFSMALDRGLLLKDSTRERAWTAMMTSDARRLPYGLGWFVQEHEGERLIWHHGQMFESSSLVLKVPERLADWRSQILRTRCGARFTSSCHHNSGACALGLIRFGGRVGYAD